MSDITERQKMKFVAINKASKQLNERLPAIHAIVNEFLNQKIILQSGGYSAKFKKALDSLGLQSWGESGNKFYERVTSTPYSLRFVVEAGESVAGGGSERAEADVYLGVISDGVLSEVHDLESIKLPQVWDHAKAMAAQNEIDSLKEKIRCLQAKFIPCEFHNTRLY